MEEPPVVDERELEKAKAIEASMSGYGGGAKKNILSGRAPKTTENKNPNERAGGRRSSLAGVAAKQEKANNGPARRSSTANLAGPSEVHAEEHKIEITRKEGLLLVRIGPNPQMARWRKRYFICKGSVLYSFGDTSADKLTTENELLACTVISDGSPKKKFSFCVALQLKGAPLDLAAPSLADKLDWLKAFEEASITEIPVPVADAVFEQDSSLPGFEEASKVGWESSNPMPTPMEHMFGGGETGPKKVDRDAWGGIDDAEEGYGADGDDSDGDNNGPAATKKSAAAAEPKEITFTLAQLQDTRTPAGVDPKKKEVGCAVHLCISHLCRAYYSLSPCFPNT
jgi:hypothetical protein